MDNPKCESCGSAIRIKWVVKNRKDILPMAKINRLVYIPYAECKKCSDTKGDK